MHDEQAALAGTRLQAACPHACVGCRFPGRAPARQSDIGPGSKSTRSRSGGRGLFSDSLKGGRNLPGEEPLVPAAAVSGPVTLTREEDSETKGPDTRRLRQSDFKHQVCRQPCRSVWAETDTGPIIMA